MCLHPVESMEPSRAQRSLTEFQKSHGREIDVTRVHSNLIITVSMFTSVSKGKAHWLPAALSAASKTWFASSDWTLAAPLPCEV